MCLTVPHKIKKVKGHKAELNNGRIVDISLLIVDEAGLPRRSPEPGRLSMNSRRPRMKLRGRGAKAGDWVLANADLAVSKITADEAKEIINSLKLKG